HYVEATELPESKIDSIANSALSWVWGSNLVFFLFLAFTSTSSMAEPVDPGHDDRSLWEMRSQDIRKALD
ncbi:hypothetical protein Hte_009621, partial [Hypoxylon texense]